MEVWKTQETNSDRQLRTQVESVVKYYSQTIEDKYRNIHKVMDHLAEDSVSNFQENDKFLIESEYYVSSLEGVDSIFWVDKEFYVKQVFPLTRQLVEVNAKVAKSVLDASNMLVWTPIYDNIVFKGFIVVEVNIPTFIASIVDDLKNEYVVQIFNENEEVFTSKDWASSDKKIIFSKTVPLQNKAELKIFITPSNSLISSIEKDLWQTRVFSLLFSTMTLLAIYYAQSAKIQYSKLKEVQEKLLRSEKLSAIGKLAGVMAHEIRNPLGTIKNSVYYLNLKYKDSLDKKTVKHMKMIESEIKISNKIISDVLDFVKAKAPILKDESVNSLIEETLSKTNIPKTVIIKTKLELKLPNLKLDAVQIMQVLLNIITNSIQAMPKGGSLLITSKMVDKYINIDIKDSGVGITTDNLKKIFDPLYSTKARGLGLGLSTCQSLVNAHKGKLEVKSNVGKGTTFTIRLPVG